jgi:hypothetical protein
MLGSWTINKRDAQKLEAAQMRFLRPLLGFTRLDHQRNLEIRNSLKVDNIVEDIKQYQRRLRRPRARWKDQEHLELQRNRSYDLNLDHVHYDDDVHKTSKRETERRLTVAATMNYDLHSAFFYLLTPDHIIINYIEYRLCSIFFNFHTERHGRLVNTHSYY